MCRAVASREDDNVARREPTRPSPRPARPSALIPPQSCDTAMYIPVRAWAAALQAPRAGLPHHHVFAGAWTAERGRCHGFVYTEDDGRPANGSGPATQ